MVTDVDVLVHAVEAAKDPRTSPERLRALMGGPGVLREHLAANPSLPHDLQREIAREASIPLMVALATNPRLCEDVQAALVDAPWEVVEVLASNPSLTPEHQRAVADADTLESRMLVVNPSLTPDLQLVLARRYADGNTRTALRALAHNAMLVLTPALPVALLEASDRGRAYMELVLTGLDADVVTTLSPWAGSLTELAAAVRSFSPTSSS